MGKINKARKDLLKVQLDNAVVEHVGTKEDDYPSWDEGTYSVFVPGAIREYNMVIAEDEAEAIEKVKVCLEQKIDLLPETETQPDNVEVSPDNLKIKTKSKIGVNNG